MAMNVSVRALAAASAALCAASGLMAQAAPAAPAAGPACTVDQQAPGQLAVVSLSLTKATASSKPEDRAKNVRDAVKRLTEKPEQFKANEAERQFALGRALMLYAEPLPGPAYSTTRGEVGFTANKEATVDLLAAADTAFTAVERLRPECVATVAGYRAQQPWLKLVNDAVAALNAQKADSAEVLARRALVVNRSNPYPYVVLANVARTKENGAGLVENSRKVIETAGADTAYADVRQRAFIDVGYTLGEQAKAAPAAQKAALTAEAAKSYRAYLAEAPTGQDAPAVQASLAQLLAASGDSTAVAATYAAMLANPAAYSDVALAQAGVTAERAKRTPDAVKLYEASLQKNPYFRDVLYNLASAYYDTKQFEPMNGVLTRLLALDPNNPDNYLLKAYYHQGKMNALKTGAAKKLHTDSLVVWNGKSKSAPVAVKVTNFQRGDAKSTLTGTLENRGAAAKPYALTVEFLDKDGKVVATQRADVGSVAPKESKPFTVTADGPGVVAYRYAPLS
jgi:tetratricopeptide (TPR) repeat protein